MEPGGADDPAEAKCSICIDGFKDPTRLVSCNHMFCRSCVTQSLRIRPHCPLCREPANEYQIVPAVPVLAQTGRATVSQRADRSGLRSRLRRHGMALPLVDPFSTVSPRRLSPSMQERLHLLATSIVASQNVPSPAPPILPALANGVPASPRPRPLAPMPQPRRSLIHFIQPSFQIPDIPPINTAPSSAPLWTPPFSILANPGRALAPPFMDFPSPPSSPSSSTDEELLDDIMEDYQMQQLLRRSSSTALQFSCPYCQEPGLDELGLLDHCNTNHRGDRRRVVCPICVSLPHGDPTYHSVDFIRHINRQHRYYNADFMLCKVLSVETIVFVYNCSKDVTQNEAINQQAAILASYNSLVK